MVVSTQAGFADEGREQQFARFAATLPEGWSGEEKIGFVSDNPDEYMLTIGKMDPADDEIAAQISVYLLPNKDGVAPREMARRLAEAQGGADEPREIDGLWTFAGEPRTNIIKGRATTYANAAGGKMLVVIVQDPENLGADAIFASLRGLDPETVRLLGR